MSITGAVAPGGHDLVLTRTVPVARSLIWDHLADPELLATWYGTYAGDPATGRVEVTMTAEPGATEAEEFTIHACETGRLLSVSSAVGEETWRLSVELADADAAEGPATRLTLRHHDLPAAMLADVGPGWEWYLDRLTAAVTGTAIPGMDVWDSQYLTLGPEYAALGR